MILPGLPHGKLIGGGGIELVASGSFVKSGTDSLDIPRPPEVQPGDFLVFWEWPRAVSPEYAPSTGFEVGEEGQVRPSANDNGTSTRGAYAVGFVDSNLPDPMVTVPGSFVNNFTRRFVIAFFRGVSGFDVTDYIQQDNSTSFTLPEPGVPNAEMLSTLMSFNTVTGGGDSNESPLSAPTDHIVIDSRSESQNRRGYGVTVVEDGAMPPGSVWSFNGWAVHWAARTIALF